jgi:hypothetical protein
MTQARVTWPIPANMAMLINLQVPQKVVNFPLTVFASLIKSTAYWTYGQPFLFDITVTLLKY